MTPSNKHIWIFILILITLREITSISRIPRCVPIQHGLDFDFNKFPRRYKDGMPFCGQYTKSCCKPSDSHRIFNEIKPVIQNNNISAKCRSLTNEIYCSACHKDIGRNQMIGICINYCNQWFNECKNEYYYIDHISDKLRPCTDSSTVCSPLYSFIRNGTDFCIASGFKVNHIYLNCFDAQNKEIYNPSTTNNYLKLLKNKEKKKKKKRSKNPSNNKPKNKSKNRSKNKSKNKSKDKSKSKIKKNKQSKKDKKLESLKKKLKKNKQSPVPWLKDTISNYNNNERSKS